MNEIFDIASSDLSEATEDAKQILMMQRMKGRPGTILFKHLPTEKESLEIGNKCRCPKSCKIKSATRYFIC